MKTVRQRSLVLGCVLLAMAGSAFADTSAGQVNKSSVIRRERSKLCYALIGSGIPQPCDRFSGPIATTTSPIDVYGRKPR